MDGDFLGHPVGPNHPRVGHDFDLKDLKAMVFGDFFGEPYMDL